jgi:protease IV
LEHKLCQTLERAVSKKNEWLAGLAIVGGALFFIFVLSGILSRGESDGDGSISISGRGDKVGVVELFGTIYDSRRIVEQVETYGDQKSVKALLIRIDSPGGLVAPSQEIFEAVRRVREKGKPVVVSMGSLAASGGYYVACGADTIVANPGTTTGSIGVIAEFVNMQDLLGKIGVRFETVKSGRYKDTGSPYREMNVDDRRYLQSWIDDAYDQFIHVVSTERRLSIEKVRELADGRVFTGAQAQKLGLVDVLGDYKIALDLAAKMGGISGEPEVVRSIRRRTTVLDLLFQEAEGYLRGMRSGLLLYRAG